MNTNDEGAAGKGCGYLLVYLVWYVLPGVVLIRLAGGYFGWFG